MSSPGLTQEEYTRRKKFLLDVQSLTKAEYIEIVRILQKHNIQYSENQNGIFFNVVSVDQSTFDDLERFIYFTQMNRKSLADRDIYLSTLQSSISNSSSDEKN